MTLHATRNGQQVTVHTTYGPVENKITEDVGHIRGFWQQLGKHLDEAEQERTAAVEANRATVAAPEPAEQPF